MTGESTSLPSLQSTRAEWNNFFGFLKKPNLPDHAASGFSRGAIAVSRMLMLDLAAMGVLLMIAGLVVVIGIELPETALAGMDITPGIILTVVLVAPLLEELLFRSWLSGRPRYLIPFAILIVAGLASAIVESNLADQAARTAVGAVMGVGGLAALIMFTVLWKRPSPSWFRAIFPAMYWLSALAFASIHLLNFSEGSWMTLLPLILPQLILGTLLGYLRVNYGLWTAIALHMIHNGLIITVVLTASNAAGAS